MSFDLELRVVKWKLNLDLVRIDLIEKNYFKEKKGTLAIGGELLEGGECWVDLQASHALGKSSGSFVGSGKQNRKEEDAGAWDEGEMGDWTAVYLRI